MRLLALDQSSRCTGYAIFEDDTLIDSGTYTLTHPEMGRRLVSFRDTVIALISKYNIDEAVFEDIQLQSPGASKAMGVTTYKALAEIMGVLMELLEEKKIPYKIIPSVTWKSELNIKGRQRAEQKKNAQAYVAATYAKKVSQDESDAICIGACYLKQKNSVYSWE